MNTYKLAVVIPCWNCEDYIGKLLECILAQSFMDWQVYCVDDLSTDNTAEVIKRYVQIDHRIHYIIRDRAPKGAPTCRNIGFALSEGAEYVVYLDADDLIAPYCLQQRVDYMEANPNIDFATFPVKAFVSRIDDDTRWGFGRKCFQDTIESLLNWRTLPMTVVSNIYRRGALERLQIWWDEQLLSMQDSDYNISTFLAGLQHSFAQNAQYDYFYRQVNGSVAKRIKSVNHVKSHLYLINKNLERLKNKPDYSFILQAYIVTMVELFCGHEELLGELCKLSWIRKKPLLVMKLRILQFTKLRGKKYLFKKETNYNTKRVELWQEFISNDICKYYGN